MTSLIIHQDLIDDIISLVKRTIDHGENSSALVIGPRGSGKTFIIQKAVLTINSYLEEKGCKDDLLVLKLSGCLQSDDKAALIEISKQLELDNVINDKLMGSFSDNFDFLLRSFRTGGKETKPILFLLDEFDLFTKHKNQLLLYTILNTLQISSSPMCLIGSTCRLDILDLLEKRIKSRFSHRQIYVFNDYDFEKYIYMAQSMISDIYGSLSTENDINSKRFKAYIDLLTQSQIMRDFLQKQFNFDKSIISLKHLLLLPTLLLDKETLKSKNIELFENEFVKSFKISNQNTRELLLNGLSILELTLIVVMKQISELFVDEPFNFDIIFNEYLKFCNKKNFGHKYEKQVVMKAYEHLIALKFILPSGENSTSTTSNARKMHNKEHALMYLAIDGEEIDECLKQYPNCPTELKYYSA
jgi:origin recognition complex subunit 4